MASKPLTKEELINLLHNVLEERKHKNTQIKYIEPYNELYDKYLLGHDMSYSKKESTEIEFKFKKTKEQGNSAVTIEGVNHLKFVIETLVKCYGKEEVVNILKDF